MQDSQFEQLRNHAVEVITRTQADAMHQLLQAGLPETVALEAMHRISSFGLQALRELDTLFLQYDDLVATAGRTPAHQAFINDKAAAILLQIQTAYATLVALTIEKTIQDYREQVAHPKKKAPTVTIDQCLTPERQSPWVDLLPVLFLFGCVLALIGWFVLWWGVSGSLIVGVLALGITVFMVVMFQLTGLLLVGIVGILILVLLAFY
jgi:hypothetical protein